MKQFIMVIALASLFGCFGSEPQKTGKEGKFMPEFSMLLLDSATLLHGREIPTGKPTVLFYFSPICPYCKDQTKEIIEDMSDLKDINFYFISNFPLSTVKSFCKEYQLNKFPNITTGIDTSRFVGNYFEISGVPFLAIYGKNKTLNKSFMGKIYSSQIREVADE